MTNSIILSKAATLIIGELKQPVISSYQLGLIVYNLYLSKSHQGKHINLRKEHPESKEYYNLRNDLLDQGILTVNQSFPSESVFNILGKDISSVEEIVCSVDPFAYISHLSAMAYHGITDRIPKTLYISTPSPSSWKNFGLKRMQKDLTTEYNNYVDSNFPKLRRINFSKKVSRRMIHCHSSLHLGAYKSIKDKMLRVSTVGRTFLDMLKNPDLCGGINHVLDVYHEYGEQYFKLILDEIDRHGNAIDKVRAGYILDERNNLHHEIIDGWLSYVQRGGSRKLDANSEYSSFYSEKWCLSLNTFEKTD